VQKVLKMVKILQWNLSAKLGACTQLKMANSFPQKVLKIVKILGVPID